MRSESTLTPPASSTSESAVLYTTEPRRPQLTILQNMQLMVSSEMRQSQEPDYQLEQLYYRKYCYSERIDAIIRNEVENQYRDIKNSKDIRALKVPLYRVYRLATQKAMLNELELVCFLLLVRELKVDDSLIKKWACEYQSLIPDYQHADTNEIKYFELKLLILGYTIKKKFIAEDRQAHLLLDSIFMRVHRDFARWRSELVNQNMTIELSLSKIILQHHELRPRFRRQLTLTSVVEEILNISPPYSKEVATIKKKKKQSKGESEGGRKRSRNKKEKESEQTVLKQVRLKQEDRYDQNI